MLPNIFRRSSSDKLRVGFVNLLAAGNTSGNVHNFNGVSCGTAKTDRYIYILAMARTNGTTGSRRYTGCTVNSSPAELLIEFDTVATAHPHSIWRSPQPNGIIADIQLSVSGNVDGVAAQTVLLYSIYGKHTVGEELSAVSANNIFNITDSPNQIILNGANSPAASPLTSAVYTFTDQNAVTGAMATCIGRIYNPSAPTQTTTTTPTGDRQVGIRLDQT